MKTIAICSNIPVFWNNKLLDEKHCIQYPGASWMPIFAKLSKKEGYEVVSGDIALRSNKKSKIFVIQELNAKHGLKLLKKNAIGAVLTAEESPIFSYYFYDNMDTISKKFKIRKLFKESFKYLNKKRGDMPIYFPSYFSRQNRNIIPINKRGFVSMVAANKSAHTPFPNGIKNQSKWLIHKLYKLYSPSFKRYSKKQLHSKRLEVIEYFGSREKLSLFGNNWMDYGRFKQLELKRLKPILDKLKPSFCTNKIETIKNYKFTFCFENISMSGYVTEKIIDCLVAGTIPIYLGAPDITEFVPKECFIDMRNFNSLKKLDSFLNSLTHKDMIKYIDAGQKFLDTENGQKFSYEYFAKDLLDIIKEIDDNDK